MKPPRGLTAEEAAAWAQVAQTVRPLAPTLVRPERPARLPDAAPRVDPPTLPGIDLEQALADAAAARASRVRAPGTVTAAERPRPATAAGLDSHWERRFRAGSIEPDFTLDLHGHTLEQAHGRLVDGIAQARAMGARVVLLIAGKARPAAAADRGTKRGAIRAKVLDWLAASSHGAAIASIRPAHIRHGGEGALYIVLKRAR